MNMKTKSYCNTQNACTKFLNNQQFKISETDMMQEEVLE